MQKCEHREILFSLQGILIKDYDKVQLRPYCPNINIYCDKRAIFLPNQSKREQGSLPGPDGSRDPGGKKDMIIDDEVIEAAKGLLLKRQEESTLTKKLKQIEKSMLLMNKQQNLLIEMINNLQTTNK